MADNDEVNIITHLLEVEKQASQVISVANVKGDKIISDAKANADSEFKRLYSEKAEKLQKDFETQKIQITENHQRNLNEYKKSVEDQPQNKEAFSVLLDKVLFE